MVRVACWVSSAAVSWGANVGCSEAVVKARALRQIDSKLCSSDYSQYRVTDCTCTMLVTLGNSCTMANRHGI